MSSVAGFAKYCFLVKPSFLNYEDIMGKTDVKAGFYAAPATTAVDKLPTFTYSTFKSDQVSFFRCC
jgi:hypothetical protein